MKNAGLINVLLTGGGIISKEDMHKLAEIGVGKLVGPGTPVQTTIDYIETKEMSAKDKVRDLDLMIEAFVEEERYEDCALLVKIKNKVIKHYKKQKIKKDE